MGIYTKPVQQLYVAYYNRPADPAGLAFWESVVSGQNGSTALVAAAFASSAEYLSLYGGKTNRAVVETVYRNLFGRDGEKAGVDFWVALLDSRAITIDGVVTAIADGARGADLVAFDNKVSYATAFTNALDVYPEQAAYSGTEALAFAKQLTTAITTDASLAAALAAMDASTAEFVAVSTAPMNLFGLSTGMDAGVAFKGGGGNDSYGATSATLTSGDQIDGGGGINSMSITGIGTDMERGLPGQVKVSNIQQVVLHSGAGVGGAAPYDLSGFAGLKQVGVEAAGAVNLKVADDVAVSVGTPSGSVTVSGGKSVGIINTTAPATLTGQALGEVSLSFTNQAVTVVNTTPNHQLTLKLLDVANAAQVSDAAAGSVQINTASASSSSKAIDINLAAPVATKLGIANEAVGFRLGTTALADADKLTTLSLSGSGAFEADLSGIATLASMDASLATGTTTIKVASIPGLSLKGSQGADSVVLTGPLSATAVVQLGAGNDVYDFSALAQTGAKVDAGAGSDTVVINDAAILGSAGPAVYSNFEILDFSSGKGKYDLDLVGAVTTLYADARVRGEVEFTNGRADSQLQFVSQTVNLDLTGKATEPLVIGANIKFGLKDASATNDKLTISMTATDGRADGRANGTVEGSTIEANGIETITIHSAVDKVEADNPATSANEARKAADYVNGFSYLRADSLKTLKVTGNASFDLKAAYSAHLATFDASGSTGNMYFDGVVNPSGGAGTLLTYLGSQGGDDYTATVTGVSFQGNGGKDTVMLYRYETVRDTVKFAQAGDSILVFGTATSAEVSAYDTVYDFQVGTDKIDLSGLHLANGANRAAFKTITLASNTHHVLSAALKDGVGLFNDGGVNRSIVFAMHNVDDGFMLVDANGDGNYTGGVDLIFNMYGNTAIPTINDFIFG